MSISAANQTTGEMPVLYINGSIIPLTCHELVDVLAYRTTVGMLMAIALLLALPSGGILLGDAPLWARIVLNVTLAGAFLGLFPALLFDAIRRAESAGRRRVPLLVASVPAAALSILATEAIAIILLDGSISRWALLAKIGFGIACFEMVLFVVIWFYAPVITAQHQKERAMEAEPTTVTIGPVRVDPKELLRIETDGRHLHLHLDGHSKTVTARLRNVADDLAPYGLLVHRCHWVAYRQVGPVKVRGRSYEMTTLNGDRLPVARDRRKAIAAVQDGRAAA